MRNMRVYESKFETCYIGYTIDYLNVCTHIAPIYAGMCVCMEYVRILNIHVLRYPFRLFLMSNWLVKELNGFSRTTNSCSDISVSIKSANGITHNNSVPLLPESPGILGKPLLSTTSSRLQSCAPHDPVFEIPCPNTRFARCPRQLFRRVDLSNRHFEDQRSG